MAVQGNVSAGTALAGLPPTDAAAEAETRQHLVDLGLLEADADAVTDEAPAEDATAEAAPAGGEAPAEDASPYDSPEEEAEAAAQAAAVAAAGGEEEKPAEETEDQKVSRLQADSSLATRERAATAMVERFKGENVGLRTENANLKNSIQMLKNLAIENPKEMYRLFGIENPMDIAEELYYGSVGDDKLPKELRERRAQMGQARRLSSLEQNIKQAEAARERIAREDRALSQLRGSAAAVPQKYVHLRDEAADDPSAYAREMWLKINKAIAEGRATAATPDDELMDLAHQDLERDITSRVTRDKRIHAKRLIGTVTTPPGQKPPVKSTTPVPPRDTTAPKSLNGKNTRVLTRPKAPVAEDREAEIERISREIAEGKAR